MENFDLEDIQKQKQLLEVKEQLALEKAFTGNDPEAIIKAQGFLQQIQKKTAEHKSFLFDPQQTFSGLGYKNKNIALTYNILRQMARSPIIRSIITTRQDQVSGFSNPTADIRNQGWTIRKKKRLFDKDSKMTKQDMLKAERIAEFLLNGGIEGYKWKRDTFEEFIRKIINDSLSFDQMTFENVRNRKGEMLEFFATDGSTYRLADTYDDDEADDQAKLRQEKVNGHYPSYVQIYNAQIVNNFYPWELCFAIRNLSTSILNNGYGVSELEDLVRIVTSQLNADAYNSKIFSNGSHHKGIIRINGNVNQSKIMEFRQQWQQQVMGVENAHRTLVMEADKMDFIDTQKTNKEMEFSKFQEYLIKICCAVYKIHPFEVIEFQSQGSQSLFSSDNAKQKIDYSKEKGLKPLLKFIESKINKYIVSEIDKDYEFIYTGIEPEDEDKVLENDIKKLVNGGMSMQDFFKKYSERDFNQETDIILNQVFLQYKQMEQQAKLYGNPDSNQNVDEQQEEETQKAEANNPFLQDLNNFIKSEFTNEKIIV